MLEDPEGLASRCGVTFDDILALGEAALGGARLTLYPGLRERPAGDAIPVSVDERRNLGWLEIVPAPADERTRTLARTIASQIALRLCEAAANIERASVDRLLDETERLADVGRWRLTVGDRRLEWSPTVYAIFGLTAHDDFLEERQFLDMVHPEDLPETVRCRGAAFAGETLDQQYRIIRPDGEIRWIRERGERVMDGDGGVIALAGVVQDITSIKRGESDLYTVFHQANDLILVTDRSGRIQRANPAAEALLGLGVRDLSTRTVFDLIPAEDHPAVLREWPRPDTDGVSASVESRLHGATETPFTVSWKFAASPDQSHVVLTGRDITLAKQNDERLRLLEASMKSLNDVVLITEAEPIDAPGPRIVYVNDAFEHRTGYSREEAVGQSPRILQGPATSRDELDRIRAAISKWEAVRAELLNYTKSGEEFWLELEIQPVSNDSGWYTHWIAVQRDITERKRAEAKERAIAERYRILFEDSPLPMWVYRLSDLRFIAVNDAAIRNYGYSRDEFLSMKIGDIRSASELNRLMAAEPATVVGPAFVGTWVHRKKSGEEIQVEVYSQVIDYEGQAARFVLPIDITHRLLLENRLRESETLSTIGRLAGGIAHDFNNLLTVINGYARSIQQKLDTGAPVADSIRHGARQIERAGERAAVMTSQLLAFSRRQVLQPREVILEDILESMRAVMLRALRDNIQLKVDLAAPRSRVWIDPSQFEQVMISLVMNASNAMPTGGLLLIGTARVDLDEEYCRHHPDLQPGQYAQVSVTDNGTGMSPETLKHVFEPFYTTNSPGEGKGLGLSIAYGIVKQSRGHIFASSELGVGSRFDIYLPVSNKPAEAGTNREFTAVNPRGRETLLLVEDEAEVREFLRSELAELGYQVIAVPDGPSALAESANGQVQIDLLVTDVVMPSMNGRELAEAMQRTYPEIQVLYISGYTEDAIVKDGVLEEGLNFLAKPCSAEELAQKVRTILDRPRLVKHVIVLDDDLQVREYLSEVIEEMGFRASGCGRAAEAISLLHSDQVDLLITDLVMPEQEGIETILRVKRLFPNLRILAISGFGGGNYLKMARALGADATLEKPIDAQALKSKIAELLKAG